MLALLAAGSGVARESGLLDSALDRLPLAVRPLLRGLLTGALTALTLCTAVVAVAVASDAAGYGALSSSLGGAGAGAVGLLALGLLLLPNAAAAVLGVAAGPGFVVGSGTSISVHGVTLGSVPALPMLAVCPTPRRCRCSPSPRRSCPRSPGWSPGWCSVAGCPTPRAAR